MRVFTSPSFVFGRSHCLRWTLALLLSVGVGGALQAGDPTPKRGSSLPGDERDIVFFHPRGPYRIRFHVHIQGKPFLAGWLRTAEHLFRFLDRNSDDQLSPKELGRAPSTTQWHQLLKGDAILDPDAPPSYLAVKGDAPQVSLVQLRRYYERVGEGPIHTLWNNRSMRASRQTDAFFKRLDRDGDGQVTRQELTGANRVLGRLDADADETVSRRELGLSGLTSQSLPGPTSSSRVPFLAPLPFQIIDLGAHAHLSRMFLHHYDRNKDGKLASREVTLPVADFKKLDRNGDGQLDTGELKHWCQLQPDVEVVVPLEERIHPPIRILAGKRKRTARPGMHIERSFAGSLLLSVPGHQIEIVRMQAAPKRIGGFRTTRKQTSLLDEFQTLDSNRDDLLDRRELYQPPFTLVGLSRLVDTNGDDRVTRKECLAFKQFQSRVHSASVFVHVTDDGNNLFGFVDVDQDERLSTRELQSVPTRCQHLMDPKKGLQKKRVLHLYRLGLSHGPVQVLEGNTLIPFPRTLQGPVWFQKMDRNRDGDVSRSEFLGTAAQFQKIDDDGDNLIDPREAHQASKSKKDTK